MIDVSQKIVMSRFRRWISQFSKCEPKARGLDVQVTKVSLLAAPLQGLGKWLKNIVYYLFRCVSELTALVIGAGIIWLLAFNSLLANKP